MARGTREVVGDDDLGNPVDPTTLEPGLGAGPSVASDGPGDGDDFDPSIHVARDKRNADGSYRKRRGRKAGGGNGGGNSSRKTSGLHLGAIEGAISFIHGMAAQANPIWALDDAEVKSFAKAIQLFQKEFDVPVSDRAVAIGALGTSLWFIYGTRLSALYMDAQARRNAAKNNHPQTGPLPLRTGQAAPPNSPQQPPPPPPRPADVINPGEGFVNGAASFNQQPPTLVDPEELARAISNPIPPAKPN